MEGRISAPTDLILELFQTVDRRDWDGLRRFFAMISPMNDPAILHL
jgi:hypothetical protein